MKSRLLAFVFLLLVTKAFDAFAQFDKDDDIRPKRPFRERIFTGGNVIFNIGSTYYGNIPITVTTIGASPIIGYRVTDRFHTGLGVTYIYYREKPKGYPAYSTNIYGGNVFARYFILKNIFAHAEYGVTNWEVPVVDQFGHYTGDYKRVNTFALPVGGGLSQPISQNAAIHVMALYDLLYYENAYPTSASPFSFRLGFNIGF